uniref:Helicase C-terminal domain-containing protein n=1 Tax=Cyprinus carpio carpio TaxID=630221 RepID=A0A8C1CMZ8_CYPCA
MAQRKRKLKKRKKSSTHRYHELQSDDEEFEVAAGIKDDQHTVSQQTLNMFCVSVMELDTRELIRAQNKKKKKSEAFQSMGETMDDQFAALHENPDMNKSIIFFFHFNRILNSIHDIFQLSFFHLRLDDKPALLLHLLRNVVKPQEQTVVFVATKHHVEYLKELLMVEGVECAYIYSALDQTASKINIGRFVQRKAMVLLVTDVVARGIDIPLLDNSRCDGLALPEHTQGTANSADIQKLKLGNNCTGASCLGSDVYRMICIYMFPQTVFEINSNNRTNASEVMRAKRSRDSRLVDKFSKVQAELIAEHIVPTITRTEPQHHEDEQEDDNVISERKSLNLKLCALCSSSLSFPLDGMFFQEGLLIYLVV